MEDNLISKKDLLENLRKFHMDNYIDGRGKI